MSYFLARHPHDPYGFMYQGVFAGRLGLLGTAASSFSRSLSLLKDDEKHMVDTIKCDLAAVLLNQGDLEQAFAILPEIRETDYTICCVVAEAFDQGNIYHVRFLCRFNFIIILLRMPYVLFCYLFFSWRL